MSEIQKSRKLKNESIKTAEYRREQDIAKARADQAYDLETARAKQDVTEQEMQIRIIERQKQIELEEKKFFVVSVNTILK